MKKRIRAVCIFAAVFALVFSFALTGYAKTKTTLGTEESSFSDADEKTVHGYVPETLSTRR